MAFAGKRFGPFATAVRRCGVGWRGGRRRGAIWPASTLATKAIDPLMARAQRTFVVAPALVASCATMTASAPGPTYAYVPADQLPLLLRRSMLDTQNAARAAVGVPPLSWNEKLAADAHEYAAALARAGALQHATHREASWGENLWMGTHRAYSFDRMAARWLDGRKHFVNQAAPAFSRTGNFADVGHYTQIVWRDSTTVGCGTSTDGRHDYLVCRYAPAGNVIGRRAY